MTSFTQLDAADLAAFDRGSYLIKRGPFTPDEILLRTIPARTSPA